MPKSKPSEIVNKSKPIEVEIVSESDADEVEGIDYEELKPIRVTPKLQARIITFVNEYCKDFHIKNATIRMGYAPGGAASAGHHLYHHPLTQQLIANAIANMEAEAMVSVQFCVAGLMREANRFEDDSSSATRIVALKELLKFAGGGDEDENRNKEVTPVLNLTLAE